MIGGTLEYLMSSLPNLSFQNTNEAQQRVLRLLRNYAGQAAEKWTPIEILDHEAQKFLPAAAFSLFQQIQLNHIHEADFRKTNSQVLSAFSAFMYELKKDLQARRQPPGEGEKKSVNNQLEELIGEGTPLDKEIRIMQYQWDKLEDLSAGQFANFEALVTYKIKLMILLRWWSFQLDKGLANFNRMTTND